MINDFYLTKKDEINIDPDVNPVLASDPKIVAKILKGKTDIVSVIEAIEQYNKDNKLAYKNRIKYSVLMGEYFITVAQGYFSTDKKTFICLAYDQTGLAHYEYGKGRDAMKLQNVTATLSTHYLPVNLIVDVVVRSYDDTMFSIRSIKENKTKDIPAEELTMILNKLLTEFNSYISSGMYKSAISAFNITFNKYKLNSLTTYKYKGAVYNLYIKIATKYIELIKDIISNYNETKALKAIRTRNNMYFISDKVCNNEALTNFAKILKDNNIKDGQLDINTLKERTFSEDEIAIYNKILAGDKETK